MVGVAPECCWYFVRESVVSGVKTKRIQRLSPSPKDGHTFMGQTKQAVNSITFFSFMHGGAWSKQVKRPGTVCYSLMPLI